MNRNSYDPPRVSRKAKDCLTFPNLPRDGNEAGKAPKDARPAYVIIRAAWQSLVSQPWRRPWIGFGLLAVLLMAWLVSDSRRVASGVMVGGISVEGLSYSALRKRCTQLARERAAQPLTLAAGGRTTSLKPHDLVYPDATQTRAQREIGPFEPERAAARAWLIGREMTLMDRLRSRLRRHTEVALPVTHLDTERVKRILRRLEGSSENATVRFVNGAVQVTPARPGVEVVPETAQSTVMHALMSGRSFATLSVRTRPAEITAEKLHAIQSVIVQVEMRATSRNPNAIRNVHLAAKPLRSVVLLPGQTLSLNRTIGERTKNKGFQEAAVFINQKVDVALGGGICVVSSIFYQAAARAGLEIVERHAHSRPVKYARPGLDATLNWGTKDLKVRNNTDAPIAFDVVVHGRSVIVTVLGASSEGKGELTTVSERRGQTLRVVTYRTGQGEREVLSLSRYRM